MTVFKQLEKEVKLSAWGKRLNGLAFVYNMILNFTFYVLCGARKNKRTRESMTEGFYCTSKSSQKRCIVENAARDV